MWCDDHVNVGVRIEITFAVQGHPNVELAQASAEYLGDLMEEVVAMPVDVDGDAA